jgi:hypothetical protein
MSAPWGSGNPQCGWFHSDRRSGILMRCTCDPSPHCCCSRDLCSPRRLPRNFGYLVVLAAGSATPLGTAALFCGLSVAATAASNVAVWTWDTTTSFAR